MTNLKSKRESIQLSQKELAERSGVNVRTLQFYEQGAMDIDGARLETLLDIAAALGCRIADIVESEELKKKLNDAR